MKRQRLWQICVGGITFTAVVPFIYFIAPQIQIWVDTSASKQQLSWTISALAVALLLIIPAFILSLKRVAVIPRDPVRRLQEAIEYYYQTLAHEKRDKTILKLRNKLTTLLHVLGMHSTRIQIGQHALVSAEKSGDWLTVAHIRIDDLGWANHLLKNDLLAKRNLAQGIEILDRLLQQSSDKLPNNERGQACLLAAKGRRGHHASPN